MKKVSRILFFLYQLKQAKSTQTFYVTCIRPVIECNLFFTTPYIIINKRISRKFAETTPLQIIHQIVSYTDVLAIAVVDTSFDGSSNVTVIDHDHMY
jgi:hypothetical protein